MPCDLVGERYAEAMQNHMSHLSCGVAGGRIRSVDKNWAAADHADRAMPPAHGLRILCAVQS